MIKRLGTVTLLVASLNLFSQELSSDELFIKARHAAFEQKDYPTSIALAKQALEKSPNYTDISVFLGRLYTWSDNLEEARAVFKKLYDRNAESEDFYIAYASLEYWNDNNEKAVEIIDKGLFYNPNSESLGILKAKAYNSDKKYEEAEKAIQAVLAINPKNTEAQELIVKINDLSSKNGFGISYNYTHFDEQFNDDWHHLTVSYKRVTPIGSVIFKVNNATKFASNGNQLEIEAYPRIYKGVYMYIGAGYSQDVGIFPKYRTGASVNVSLPKSFEAEVGYRQLYFSDNIWMYTASLGKYYKNFWFNLRTYLTPDSKNISHSYTGTVRYYTKGAEDYFSFQAGTGISPEEGRNNLLEYETFKLITYKLGAGYSFSINKTNLFSVSGTYFNQEYRPGKKGNQYDISVSYSKKF